MNLFEHADFGQSILRAAQHFQARGLRPAIIVSVAELSAAISAEYEAQCRLLCYGAYPS